MQEIDGSEADFGAALDSGDGLKILAVLSGAEEILRKSRDETLSQLPGNFDNCIKAKALERAYLTYDMSTCEFNILYRLGLIVLLKVDTKTGTVANWDDPMGAHDDYVMVTLPSLLVTLRAKGVQELARQVAVKTLLNAAMSRAYRSHMKVEDN